MVAGEPLRMGTAAIRDFVPADRHARPSAGCATPASIFVGKTNTPEFGILPVTEPDAFGADPQPVGHRPHAGRIVGRQRGRGRRRNDRDRLRRRRRRVDPHPRVVLRPRRPEAEPRADLRRRRSPGELVAGWATEGVVTRTVADTAAALDVMAGYETGDPYWAPPPSAPFAQAAEREPGKLRIAFTTESPNGVPVHEHCVAAVREAAELLESLGHEVIEGAARLERAAATSRTSSRSGSPRRRRRSPRSTRCWATRSTASKLEPLTQEMVAAADGVTTTEYLNSLRWLQVFSRGVVGLLERHRRPAHPHARQAADRDRRAAPGGGRAGDPDAAERRRASCRSRRRST